MNKDEQGNESTVKDEQGRERHGGVRNRVGEGGTG